MQNAEAISSISRFPQRLHVRMPDALLTAVAVAAGRRFQTPSEYARQALLQALAEDGVALAPNSRAETGQP
jgi:hypothetical protein